MTDVELYAHFSEYVTEVHKDGMCFVEPYHYVDFVSGLDIRDCEQGFDAFISTNGTLCFNIDDVEYFFDEFDVFKEAFIENHAV